MAARNHMYQSFTHFYFHIHKDCGVLKLSVSIGKFLRKDLYKNIFLGINILSKEDDMAPYFSLGNRVIDMVIFTVC